MGVPVPVIYFDLPKVGFPFRSHRKRGSIKRVRVCIRTHHDASLGNVFPSNCIYSSRCITVLRGSSYHLSIIIYDEVSFDFPFRRMRRIALHHAASRTLECVYSILLTFHRFKDGVGVGAFVASLLKRSRTEQRK